MKTLKRAIVFTLAALALSGCVATPGYDAYAAGGYGPYPYGYGAYPSGYGAYGAYGSPVLLNPYFDPLFPGYGYFGVFGAGYGRFYGRSYGRYFGYGRRGGYHGGFAGGMQGFHVGHR